MTANATLDSAVTPDQETPQTQVVVSGMAIDLSEIDELRSEFPGASDAALALVVSERRETREMHQVRMAEVRRRVRQELDALRKQRCQEYVSLLCGRDQRARLAAAASRDQAWSELAAARIAYRTLGGKVPSTHGEGLVTAEQRAATAPPQWVKAFTSGRVDDAAQMLGFTV